jgi:transposase
VPLVDLSMVEQRYDAVKEVLDGATVTDTAIRYGVDRRTLHRWLVRYATDGLAALADKSSRPDRCPHQMAPEVEARIVELRRSHPGWGPRTILNKLRRELEQPPSRAAIYRCLVRHRLIQPKPRRRRRDDYKRWERSRSMELWEQSITHKASTFWPRQGGGPSGPVLARLGFAVTMKPFRPLLARSSGVFGFCPQFLIRVLDMRRGGRPRLPNSRVLPNSTVGARPAPSIRLAPDALV